MLLPALMLTACERARLPQEDSGAATSAPADRETEGAMASPQAAANAPSGRTNDRVPRSTAAALTPDAERGVKGARDLLIAFARAVEGKRFGEAWGLLSPADRRRWDRAAFAAMFADLRNITVAIPAGTMEGAAGSSYYSAPVTITGDGRDGRPVRIEGEAVLRRINDVDGASPAQRRWHFERLTLGWTH